MGSIVLPPVWFISVDAAISLIKKGYVPIGISNFHPSWLEYDHMSEQTTKERYLAIAAKHLPAKIKVIPVVEDSVGVWLTLPKKTERDSV
jgi:hypothetical protein